VSAPPIIWLDERVASRMPQQKDPELAERGVDQVRYIIQNRVNDLVAAARGPSEFIVQIVDHSGMIFGLSNHGRLWAFGNFTNTGTGEEEPDSWQLIAEGLEPEPEP
jgi:hypothetical protein